MLHYPRRTTLHLPDVSLQEIHVTRTVPVAPVRAKECAILCAGLDDVRRGYETHTRMLFDALTADRRKDFRFHLIKRNGIVTTNETPLYTPSRSGLLCRGLSHLKGDPLFWEGALFGLAFAAQAFFSGQRYHKILVIEPVVAKVIGRLRRFLPGSPKILFTHGVNNSPEDYIAAVDEVHEVNIENYRKLDEYLSTPQAPEKGQHLVPHFLVPDSCEISRRDARIKYGVHTPKVALSVGSVEAGEKRMDHVISEVERLGPDWSLVICGKCEDEALLEGARRRLGPRFRHLYLEREKMPEVYRLADVLISASLEEGFGLSILEGMRAGLPVFTHNRAQFRWILKDSSCCVDMTEPGVLAGAILKYSDDALKRIGNQNRLFFEQCYTWDAVKKDYYRMYA